MSQHCVIVLAALAAGLVLSPSSVSAQQKATSLDSATVAGFRWRNVGPANTRAASSDVAGIPLPVEDVLRRRGRGRHLEDHERRHRPCVRCSTTSASSRWACSPSRRRTRSRCGPARASRIRATPSPPAAAIYKSHRRRHDVEADGAREDAADRPHRRASDESRTSSTSRRSARAWNANPERGLYKTDRRRQDVAAHQVHQRQGGLHRRRARPVEPERRSALRAGARARSVLPELRRPRLARSGRSTDAGKTWTEIKGGGFPETTKGRISIAISRDESAASMYATGARRTRCCPNPKPAKAKPAAKIAAQRALPLRGRRRRRGRG